MSQVSVTGLAGTLATNTQPVINASKSCVTNATGHVKCSVSSVKRSVTSFCAMIFQTSVITDVNAMTTWLKIHKPTQQTAVN
jgi:hypothetical protein